MKLYPTILTDSVATVQHQLNLVKEHRPIEVVQIDIIDGQLADNVTVTPSDLTGLDFGQLQLDFHLMVEEPMDFLHELIEYRARLPVRAVIAQVERMSFQADFLEMVKKEDWLRGLCLDLHTPLSAIEPNSWAELDIIQLMGVELGFQGQTFAPQVFVKLKGLADQRTKDNLKFAIIVDGGVKASNAKELAQLGVTGVAVGSALWQAEDLRQTVEQLTNPG